MENVKWKEWLMKESVLERGERVFGVREREREGRNEGEGCVSVIW